MARLVLLAQAPPHLDGEEAEAWLREQLAALVGMHGIERVSLARLESVSIDLGGSADWLVEMDCSAVDDAVGACRNGALRDLIGDLRLIGMHPSLALLRRPDDLLPPPLG
jgi:hypothetical protein